MTIPAIAAAEAFHQLAFVTRPIRILYLALTVWAAKVVTLTRVAILIAVLTFLNRTLVHLHGLSDCVRIRLTRHIIWLRIGGRKRTCLVVRL